MANVLLAGESWISTTVEYKGFDSFSNTKLEIGCERFLESRNAFRGPETSSMNMTS